MELASNRLMTKVKDNGIGFDPESISEKRFGIKIMRERAESLGGNVRIISTPALGSLIEIDLPVVI